MLLRVLETRFLRKLFVSHLRKVVFLIAVIVVALAATVYAYFLSLPQAGPRVSITSPPLEFSLELNKAEYQYGENITIVLCLRNISNQTITVGKSSMWIIDPSYGVLTTEADGANFPEGEQHYLSRLFHFGFSITHQNGTVIFKEYIGPAQMTYDFTIEHGGYIKQTFIWVNPLPTVSYHIPRGIFQIRGIFKAGIVGVGSITLETPTITFTYM